MGWIRKRIDPVGLALRMITSPGTVPVIIQSERSFRCGAALDHFLEDDRNPLHVAIAHNAL